MARLEDRQAAARRLRTRMEAAVERLIDALDALDSPDEDLDDESDANDEDQGGEPSLGATLAINQIVAWGAQDGPWGAWIDCELDDADREPWLGSIEFGFYGGPANQLQWAVGDTTDREYEHDGREPEDGI